VRSVTAAELSIWRLFYVAIFNKRIKNYRLKLRETDQSINQSKALISVGQNVTDYSVRGKKKYIYIYTM